jgi:hypothetical protein
VKTKLTKKQAKNYHAKRYGAGADLERKVKNYFEAQGFDAMRSAGSHGKFDVMADNGVSTWKVQCKKGMGLAEAEKLVEELAQDQAARFKEVNHPIVIYVCVSSDSSGSPLGTTRVIVPAGTTVKGGMNKANA